jgi:PIN domain
MHHWIGGLGVRTNVVLIDFESVQPVSLAALEQDHYRVMVFVGATQAKLPFEVVSAIQRMGDRAEYVKISGAGPNALDFHIAFYIGQLASQDPTIFFHVISKDAGFDPLIRHLKSRHIFAARSETIDDIPLVKAAGNQSSAERAKVFVAQLRQPKSTKPRTDRTLARAIATFFQKQKLTDAQVAEVVASMQKSGHVRIVDGKVAYALES